MKNNRLLAGTLVKAIFCAVEFAILIYIAISLFFNDGSSMWGYWGSIFAVLSLFSFIYVYAIASVIFNIFNLITVIKKRHTLASIKKYKKLSTAFFVWGLVTGGIYGTVLLPVFLLENIFLFIGYNKEYGRLKEYMAYYEDLSQNPLLYSEKRDRMKYSITDSLSDFEFHDASFTLVSWEDDCLVVLAKGLNIHKDAAPEEVVADMQIAEARITFTGFRVTEFEPSRTWKTDENGKSYTDDPLVIHTDGVARDMLETELRNSVSVYGIIFDNGVYEIGAVGIDPYFSARFVFSSVMVEWDKYLKKAWYELHKQNKKQITLSSHRGDFVSSAHIITHEEEVYSPDGTKIESPSVSVGVELDGQWVFGYGKEYNWEDAFADLQVRLPRGVKIKCCMTCRHGNMCPFGNAPGEIFCTQDVVIGQKYDLGFYTTDEDEQKKRSRDCTAVCENYQEQTEDIYVYNSYLYFLNKTNDRLQEQHQVDMNEAPQTQ